MNLPSLRTTVGEMAGALEKVAGKAATRAAGLDARSGNRAPGQDLARQRDVRAGARRSDCEADLDFESIVRDYIRENPGAVKLPVR